MKRYLILVLIAVTALVLGSGPLHAAGRSILTEAKVKKIITDYLYQRTENMGIDIRLKSVGFSGEIILPPGTVSHEIVSTPEWEGWGRTSLALIVRVDDRVEKNISVPIEVEASAGIVVAARPLDFGTIVKPGDVTLQKRDLSQIQGRVCRNIDDVLGKRMRVAVRASSPVRSDYLERLPLVKNGQMVTIILENNAFRITATGRARSNGAEGDMVMVQSLNTHKEIPAVVLHDGSVRVEF